MCGKEPSTDGELLGKVNMGVELKLGTEGDWAKVKLRNPDVKDKL